MQIKVSQGTVWKKRSVKNKPCLKDVDNYDQYFQQAVSKIIGCVPPFWTRTINLAKVQEECTSLEKLMQAKNLIEDYKRTFDEIMRPCIDMFNSVLWSSRRNWEAAYMEILYADRYYEEILQVEDFSIQDFISNLGGFIGIFLGYSMMQIPELLGKFQNVAVNMQN